MILLGGRAPLLGQMPGKEGEEASMKLGFQETQPSKVGMQDSSTMKLGLHELQSMKTGENPAFKLNLQEPANKVNYQEDAMRVDMQEPKVAQDGRHDNERVGSRLQEVGTTMRGNEKQGSSECIDPKYGSDQRDHYLQSASMKSNQSENQVDIDIHDNQSMKTVQHSNMKTFDEHQKHLTDASIKSVGESAMQKLNYHDGSTINLDQSDNAAPLRVPAQQSPVNLGFQDGQRLRMDYQDNQGMKYLQENPALKMGLRDNPAMKLSLHEQGIKFGLHDPQAMKHALHDSPMKFSIPPPTEPINYRMLPWWVLQATYN